MATPRKHKRRNQRKGGRFFRIYVLLSAVVILLVIAAGSLVFFRAHTFEVRGNSYYTEEELLAAAGIQEGQNMFQIPRSRIQREMETSLPYLKRVRIGLWPPERVVITVEETTPAGVLENGGVYWYLDSGGKLLEQVAEQGAYPLITGLAAVEPSAGAQLAVGEEDDLRLRGLLRLLQALEDRDLVGKIGSVDLTGASSVSMLYDGRITVRMGLGDDFAYDLKMLLAAEDAYIRENWSETDTGTMDMTRESGEAVLSKD